MASKQFASDVNKKIKSRVIAHTAAAQNFTQRHDVSSRQRSMIG